MRGGGKKREQEGAAMRQREDFSSEAAAAETRARTREAVQNCRQFSLEGLVPGFRDWTERRGIWRRRAARGGRGEADKRDERSGRGPFLTQMETILFPREKMKRDYFALIFREWRSSGF